MSDHSQSFDFSPVALRRSLRGRSLRGRSPSSWAAEPSFGEMINDPVFQIMMASDRVSMESLNGLVSAVRERLGR